jgi:hypothetical protein
VFTTVRRQVEMPARRRGRFVAFVVVAHCDLLSIRMTSGLAHPQSAHAFTRASLIVFHSVPAAIQAIAVQNAWRKPIFYRYVRGEKGVFPGVVCVELIFFLGDLPRAVC